MYLTKREDEKNTLLEPSFRFGSVFDELWPAERLRPWTPPMDVSETEREYKVRLEAPGVNKEDIKVELENSVLTISGEKTHKIEEKDEKHYSVERSYGSFARKLRFSGIDNDKVSASFKDGVLEVTIAKIEAARPKRIDIG